jgi:PAS domain S-box-containing protein
VQTRYRRLLRIVLSKRISNPDGSFGGLIAAAIDPFYFKKFYSAMQVGPGGLIDLMRKDGVCLIRVPFAEEALTYNFAGSDLFTKHLPQAAGGVYLSESPISKKKYLTAYQTITGSSLIAVVSLLEDDYLGAWRARATREGIWFLALAVLLGGLTCLMLRGLKKLEESEQALRQSEVNYRLLVNQIPAVVYKGYTDWTLDCFDRKIEAITGYPKEDFDSRRVTWLDLIFAEDQEQAKNLFNEARKNDGFYVTTHRIRKKTGEIRWIEARNQIIRDAAGKTEYISGVFFDVTDHKRLEDQLIQAQKMEAVGMLAGGVAHDFNNLLTAIMGYGDLMMMALPADGPYLRHLKEIAKAATQGASLTQQLLAFSRKQILQPQLLDLGVLVADMEKMLRRLIGEDIDLVSFTDPHLALVQADPGQIQQIIMNLAVNARDAMPKGGRLTLETANVYLDEAYVRSRPEVSPGPYVMLAVSDSGLGMDAETMSHIFEPFFTTKESGKGTGLGLATVYGIVKQSGGHVWVYSEPGHGTTFRIYLPRTEEAEGPVKPQAAPVTSLEGVETVLVVEDDPNVRELITTALKMYGYLLLVAGHGDEALQHAEKHKAPIHLMLTDVVMPQISGRDLWDRLAPLHPEMKVLFMSGYTQNAIVHHGVLDSGINFIQKPFKVLALVQKVREVLDYKEQ